MRNSETTVTAFPEAAIHFIESLASRREYAAVVNYYEKNRSEIEGLGGAKTAICLRLIALAYASLNNHSAALKTARMAQKKASEENDNILLGEIFVTVAGSLVQLGEFKEAEKAYRDAESIFRRNDNLEGQSRALNLLSGLFFKRNDFQNSMAALTEALVIARKLNDTKKIAYMMGNLGRINTFLGDFDDAIKHLQINIDLSTELADWLEVGRAYLSLAYVRIQTGDFENAEQNLAWGYVHIAAENSQRDIVIYLTYLGELYRRSGRLDQADESLRKALQMAEDMAPNSFLHGRAMRQLAELQVCRKNYTSASRMAARAMVMMQQFENTIEMGALIKLKAIVADAKNDVEQCHKLFNKSLEILGEASVRFEKTDALVAAGKCRSFTNRQRLIYLFRAEEYFTRHRISTRLEEVGVLIGELGEGRPDSNGIHRTAGSELVCEYEFRTESPEIKQFLKQLSVIGRTDLPILLMGETGVGKDHLARYYHSLVRPGSPFIAINCASVPETLLESELFGHKRGAFTGAENDKPGLFVAANGGVLFLDEIGDMPLSLQAKLLGVLEHKKLTPLGSTKEVELDIKLVAASNRDLDVMVEQGRFRRDLFFRLSGMSFCIPSLRDRKEDIPMLLNQFLKDSSLLKEGQQVPTEMLKQFLEYDWPGNVRELQNKVRKLEVMAKLVAEGDIVELSRSLLSDEYESKDSSLTERVEEFERQLILEALLAAKGNKSHAARMLGIHEATVRTKLKRYGISLAG
jgi:DNA-binding NtrC family response regulator/tetratricopeptide (TPR) repeat protein